MKKLFAIFTAALLLAACGSENKGENGKEPLVSGATDFKGTMVVTFQGEDVSTPDVTISVDYHKSTSTADILFKQVKFVPQMPVKLDITVPGVTVKQNGSTILLSGTGIEPTVAGVPYEQYLVSNLSGNIKSGYLELQLSFGDFPTRFLGAQIE